MNKKIILSSIFIFSLLLSTNVLAETEETTTSSSQSQKPVRPLIKEIRDNRAEIRENHEERKEIREEIKAEVMPIRAEIKENRAELREERMELKGERKDLMEKKKEGTLTEEEKTKFKEESAAHLSKVVDNVLRELQVLRTVSEKHPHLDEAKRTEILGKIDAKITTYTELKSKLSTLNKEEVKKAISEMRKDFQTFKEQIKKYQKEAQGKGVELVKKSILLGLGRAENVLSKLNEKGVDTSSLKSELDTIKTNLQKATTKEELKSLKEPLKNLLEKIKTLIKENRPERENSSTSTEN
jgi:uncharacterized coiled-coil DUF342 family protein